ncbi:hypothetical protein FACS1894111_05610 [Clostridia bacterium]|nr:hypothetical protein FACS1894111_05610 [Clostridia bacterium]
MNDTVYDIDFTRALPEPLKNDTAMLALGRAIAGELQENIRLSRLAIIYARLDELDEQLLDILARDLHVDWYEDTYPVQAKRQVIKDSVKVHKRLGTKYAMTTALGSVFPHTEVQEWYEYGGTHHRFRIILDFTNAKAPADIFQVIRTQKFYKRLTAHLDEIIIQMSAVVEIKIETTTYRYRQGMTGKYNAGTHPHRNTKGGVASAKMNVKAEGVDFEYQVPRAGTKPQRSTVAALREVEITAEDTGQAFKGKFGMSGQYTAGTHPHRTTGGGVASGNIEVTAESKKNSFHSTPTGTKPKRNIEFASLDDRITAETKTEAFLFATNMTGKSTSGTKPHRTTGFSSIDNGVTAKAAAEAFSYLVNMTGKTAAGTKPNRFAEGRESLGGFAPVITTETFYYKIKRCGTSVTKNN